LTKIASTATTHSLIAPDAGSAFATVQMEEFRIINIANDQTAMASKTLPFHGGMSIAPFNA
jgi:hypothetical protein